MPPPSLLQLATAAAIRNVKYLNDIGNLPYNLARPFLLRIESPEKLRSLEEMSPHIMKHDNELWLEFIKRDIPNWEKYDLPEKSDNWYAIYCDLREQLQFEVDKDTEKLKMALEGISSERAEKSAKFVTDRRTLGLPNPRPTMKQKYASYDRKMGGLTPIFAGPGKAAFGDPLGAPMWTYERPSIPRSESSKKNKNNIFTATKRNTALTVPTKQLNSKASQVKQAPRSLIEDHRRPVGPAVPARRNPPVSISAPGRSRVPMPSFGSRTQTPSLAMPDLKEREARLRALTSGKQMPARTSNTPGPSSATSGAKRKRSLSDEAKPESNDAAASLPKEGSLDSLLSGSETDRAAMAKSKSTGLTEGGASSDGNASKSPPPPQTPARRTIIRKRPAPNIFIQPKKRRTS